MKKIHPIRPITTRRYYAGTQAVSLRINGKDFGLAEFDFNHDWQDLTVNLVYNPEKRSWITKVCTSS